MAMWWLYESLLVLALLGYLPSALWRRRLPHAGWTMRLGRYPDAVRARLSGEQPLWVHAVSVGEVLAAQPLVRAFTQRNPAAPLVLSTITPSGFAVATKQAGERGIPIYFPLDLRVCVTRALDTFRPRALLLMESELWPTMIRLAQARGIPVVVVNGRLSPRAFRRHRWARPLLGGTFKRVDLFLMQSQADADRLLQLGVALERVRVVGSLKWDASLGLRPSPQMIRETSARLRLDGSEAVLVAGSTHRGEETAVLKAFQALRASYPSARLIIAPRHLERLAEVDALIRQGGLSVVRLSQQPSGTGRWGVGLVDTFGQLPVYYALATMVFIGGSLIPHGGQNPLEATSLGKPVIFGPSMHNFESITHQLLAHHAARQAANAEELVALCQELFADQAGAAAMGRRAQELTERFQGATQRTLEALAPLLATGADVAARPGQLRPASS